MQWYDKICLFAVVSLVKNLYLVCEVVEHIGLENHYKSHGQTRCYGSLLIVVNTKFLCLRLQQFNTFRKLA